MLTGLSAVLALLAMVDPAPPSSYPALVEWQTIAALAGLLLLTKAIESSGYLGAATGAMLEHIHTQRSLALVLVVTAAMLSTVLTNDIALFVVVPLTLTLRKTTSLPIARLIVFEALAVNAGSALTPIGNPQNLFLWQTAGVSFFAFTRVMLPLFAVCMGALLLLTAVSFRGTRIGRRVERDVDADATTGFAPDQHTSAPSTNPRLLIVALALYVPFIVAADMHHAVAAALALFVGCAIAYRRVLRDIDWALLVVFVLMFIDLRLVAAMPATRALLQHVDLSRPEQILLAGVVASQVISNVPATILLQKYTQHWQLLAYAVNIGGFGVALGSLANIIALRLSRERGIGWTFHAYSLPFLVLIAAAAYVGIDYLPVAPHP